MGKKKITNIKIFIILLFGIFCVFTTCDSGENYPSLYPSLKVVNQFVGRSIKSVSLVGYNFNSLLITAGNSQLFALDGGMPGGYEDINVTVLYGSAFANWNASNTFDFNDGETTTITLHDNNTID